MYDNSLILSNAQSIAAVASSILSTSSYDTWQGGAAGASSPPIGGPLLNDIGRDNVPLMCEVVTPVASAGAATVDFQLVQADDAALGTNLATINTTGPLAAGTQPSVLVQGYQPALPPILPPGRITQRWVGLRYVIATATTTAGAVSAGLNWDRQTNVNAL